MVGSLEERLQLIAAASCIPAIPPGEEMKGLRLIRRAVLTHRQWGRLCPQRGLCWGWGTAQEGLSARGGDAALI